MKTYLNKFCSLAIIAILVLGVNAFAIGQEEEVASQDRRAASIERMQKRVAAIEKEVKDAETARANSLGDEAFGLIGEIDQTFMQMKNSYQQQVALLNDRMCQMWAKIEDAEGETRESLDKKLAMLESDWDRVYNHLTRTHDGHLDQMNNSIAKLRGELSDAAGIAESELETSHVESLSRWEQAHEIFLKISQTHAKTIGDQLRYLQQRSNEQPGIQSLSERLTQVRNRYLEIQGRLQERYETHVEHLGEELDARQIQLGASSGWEAKEKIRKLTEQLWHRQHTTFKDLQDSYRETIAAVESASSAMKANLRNKSGDQKEVIEKKLSEFQSAIADLKNSLKQSYAQRVEVIESEIGQLNEWLAEVSTQDKKRIKGKIKELGDLATKLKESAVALTTKTDDLSRR